MTILPPEHFRLYPLRFSFVARESVHFPPGKSANILRGAFGSIFQRIACVPDCPGARECEIRAACPYARMFEPSALAGGPSGLADWPRPLWPADRAGSPTGPARLSFGQPTWTAIASHPAERS